MRSVFVFLCFFVFFVAFALARSRLTKWLPRFKDFGPVTLN